MPNVAYYDELSTNDLQTEIEREEAELEDLQSDLYIVLTRQENIQRQYVNVRARGNIQEIVEELEDDLTYLVDRSDARQIIIEDNLDTIDDLLEDLTRFPTLSIVSKIYTRRRVRRLRYSVKAYRGWQTRDSRRIRVLQQELVQYTPYLTHVELLEQQLINIQNTINTLQTAIESETEELDKKYESLEKYEEWEFAKYYKYTSRESYKHRHFEIRGTFTLPREVDPEDVKNVIEQYFDDTMINLGIDPIHFVPPEGEQGWINTGAERLGVTETFANQIELVVVSLFNNRIRYIWKTSKSTYDTPYNTTIIISESELSGRII